jgi:hypothetical protein
MMRSVARRTFVATMLVASLAVGGAPAAHGADREIPHVFTGTGSIRTRGFQLPGHWTLVWSFDCAGSVAGPGVFSIQVVQVDGSPSRRNVRIPRLLRFDNAGFGTEQYDQGGTRAFFRIASQCSWTVTEAPIVS